MSEAAPFAGAARVRVVRSGFEESVHDLDVSVVGAAGDLVAFAGDPGRAVYARSSMKPLQAAVSLSLAPLPFSDAEVAVMCASHNAEPVHLEAVRAVLARVGVGEEALRCPATRPRDADAAAAAPDELAINSDCSGKHAGMLAACTVQGWPLSTYREPEHPLQRRVLAAVLAATGLPEVHIGVDGCGIPVHGMPLQAMAAIYARLAAPAALGELAPFAERAIAAMRAEPYLVAGRGRVDTAVMRRAPGIVVKSGAEGLICAAVQAAGLGVAIKSRDGAGRPAGPALIEVLRLLDALDDAAARDLAEHARPVVLGGGRPVGEATAEVALARP